MTGSARGQALRVTLAYGAIIVVTLALLDGILIGLHLFPPSRNDGDRALGWRPAAATGHMAIGKCLEYSTGQIFYYVRNEDGVRSALSRSAVLADTTSVRIGVTGDSQTDLCATNEYVHGGFLQSALRADSLPATVLTYGSGRYSPLQAYLAFREVLGPYKPDVFVLNLYTGNDLYDILRADDRPNLVREGSGYRIAPPIWYSLDDPDVQQTSRVLFAARSFADKTGLRGLLSRLSALRRLAKEQEASLGTVAIYMRDLWRAREPSIGYADALTAQMLNQQLFFHHFPASLDESFRRVRWLMELIERENPGILLVLSPIPSYELTQEQPVDSVLGAVLERLPISYEGGVREEGEIYQRLAALARERDWVFVDNLTALRGYSGNQRLFNNFDYHLLPVASQIVGNAEASALAPRLRPAH